MLGACSDPVSGEAVGSRPRAPAGGAPVAGFDLTFSVSKSISVMWALGDDETRNVIEKCHREAIEFVISYAEHEVFCSRSGTNGIVSEASPGSSRRPSPTSRAGLTIASCTNMSSSGTEPALSPTANGGRLIPRPSSRRRRRSQSSTKGSSRIF